MTAEAVPVRLKGREHEVLLPVQQGGHTALGALIFPADFMDALFAAEWPPGRIRFAFPGDTGNIDTSVARDTGNTVSEGNP